MGLRAGLDCWEWVDLWVHPNWQAFRAAVSRERCLYLSTHGTRSYTSAPYAENSVLVFGSETEGVPRRQLRLKLDHYVLGEPQRGSDSDRAEDATTDTWDGERR